MAISLASFGTPISTGASASPLTQSLPGTYADNDLLISHAHVRSVGTLTAPPGVPSGRYTNSIANSASSIRIYMDWTRASGTETAPQYTASSLDSTHRAFGAMLALTGCLASGDPIDTPVLGSGTATDVTIPDFTPSEANEWVIAYFAMQSTATYTISDVPAGWSFGYFLSTTTGNNFCYGCIYQPQTTLAAVSSFSANLQGASSAVFRVGIYGVRAEPDQTTWVQYRQHPTQRSALLRM